MQTQRIFALLLLFFCTNLLLAQRDSLELDLGGESVEVSSFTSPVQQITSQQRWFQFFAQIDSINAAPSSENSHPGNDELALYEELPYTAILQDYQGIQHYLQHQIFAYLAVRTLIDSTALAARKERAILLTAYREPGDTSALSDREREYGMKRILGAGYPLTRDKLWRKADWEPRLLRKDVMYPVYDLNNPYFLRTPIPIPDSLRGKIVATAAAFAAYTAVEDMVYFLRQGLSNTSSRVDGTWFVRLMNPIQRQVEIQADSFYAKREANPTDGFVVPRMPEPWLEEDLVAEVLTDSINSYDLLTLQRFHDQLDKICQDWSKKHMMLESLLVLHRDSLSTLEVDFCAASLAELGTQLDLVKGRRSAVAQVLKQAEQDPSYARMWEMVQHYTELRDHFIGNAMRIEDVYHNEELNALAQQVHEYYLVEVRRLQQIFLEEARRVHRP